MIEIRQDMRAAVEALYESEIQFALFDRRVLLPWAQLPGAVEAETGEVVSPERLEEMARDGLFPVGEADGAGRGVCLYVPSRIGLFLKLERDGYELSELKLLAEYEEWLVEGVLTVDDLSYEDDDRQILLNLCEDQIDSLETQLKYARDEADAERAAADLEGWRRSKDLIERISVEQLTTEGREQVRRQAYFVRFTNEMCRNQLLDGDRAKIRAGYSPMLIAHRSTYSAEGEFNCIEIDWRNSLRQSYFSETERPLRVPGFVLSADRVVPIHTLIPSEYQKRWAEYGLSEYLRVRAEIQNERVCWNCFKELPADSKSRRRYCGDSCKAAASQKRFRQRHPDRVVDIQARYYGSLDQPPVRR